MIKCHYEIIFKRESIYLAYSFKLQSIIVEQERQELETVTFKDEKEMKEFMPTFQLSSPTVEESNQGNDTTQL